MALPYEHLDHTADAGFRVVAASAEELFRESAHAVNSLLVAEGEIRCHQKRLIEVEADDLEQLLVAWLSELIFIFESDWFLVAEVEDAELWVKPRARFRARAVGEPYQPRRHQLGTEIKGVTYHALKVVEMDGSWHAQFILDL